MFEEKWKRTDRVKTTWLDSKTALGVGGVYGKNYNTNTIGRQRSLRNNEIKNNSTFCVVDCFVCVQKDAFYVVKNENEKRKARKTRVGKKKDREPFFILLVRERA